jgi:cytochrome c oxidase cbb3-type subunit III
VSTGMSAFVIAGTLLSLLFFFLLLHFNRHASHEGEITKHNYDGIEEYDNPLPSWWYWGFVMSIIYALGYLAYYPGLGNFEGLGNWSQVAQLQKEQDRAAEKYGPIFSAYGAIPIDELAENTRAMKMGRRIFANNCAVCHGATGSGSLGFPNLTDEEWMWGGTNEDIVTTITQGRNAAMIAWKDILGEDGVTEVAEYVTRIAGREVDEELASKGEARYQTYCIACHGVEGQGQKIFGAPDLSNEVWLYGNSRLRIQDVIRNGRSGVMPSFKRKLGEDKIHIMAAYVKSLRKDY